MGFLTRLYGRGKYNVGVFMTAEIMQNLADGLKSAGFVIKKIEEEIYGSFDKSPNGEKYTGELSIRIRSIEDEEAEAEAVRLRKEKEREVLT